MDDGYLETLQVATSSIPIPTALIEAMCVGAAVSRVEHNDADVALPTPRLDGIHQRTPDPLTSGGATDDERHHPRLGRIGLIILSAPDSGIADYATVVLSNEGRPVIVACDARQPLCHLLRRSRIPKFAGQRCKRCDIAFPCFTNVYLGSFLHGNSVEQDD